MPTLFAHLIVVKNNAPRRFHASGILGGTLFVTGGDRKTSRLDFYRPTIGDDCNDGVDIGILLRATSIGAR